MKKGFIILFSFLFLNLTFEKGIILMSHYLRQDFIATNYCVNPNTSCQGSCHLKKELKSSGERAENPAIPDVSNLLEKVFLIHSGLIINHHNSLFGTTSVLHTPGLLKGIPSKIFHPPVSS